ncbi:hypothetical protein BAU15_11015 [Enterococcus sp. JM4C]|uniref:hypothetical protein n=1 Tax=Candidatus Enterococcus huntleyi TaxID=1857217 RepID=UPI0013793FF2|nr:hypothetical protein [Enterococcus sp. JM4C]KAF1298648.1 hypothetical protein BAU15_11015 [Enterococcus sp. JM4C]
MEKAPFCEEMCYFYFKRKGAIVVEILVIIEEAQLERSSIIYSKLDTKKTLVQFSPEFSLAEGTLGELYQKEGISGIRRLFYENFHWQPDGYVRVKLNELITVVGNIMPEGVEMAEETLLLSDLPMKMSYHLSENDDFAVFHFQRAVLKALAKTIGKKQNLFKVPHYLSLLSKICETNLNNSQFFSLLKGYASLQDVQSTKLIIPVPETYEIQKDESGLSVKMTDSERNIQILENLIKDS